MCVYNGRIIYAFIDGISLKNYLRLFKKQRFYFSKWPSVKCQVPSARSGRIATIAYYIKREICC